MIDEQINIDFSREDAGARSAGPTAVRFPKDVEALIEVPMLPHDDEPPDGPFHDWIPIFDKAAIEALKSNPLILGENRNATLAALKKLSTRGVKRPRTIARPGQWQSDLRELLDHSPNFAEPIKIAKFATAIDMAPGRSRMPPMLLVGGAGIGKTHFVRRLAQYFQTPLVTVDLASATISASLSGLDVHWGNSSPGRVFQALSAGVDGQPAVANPLFFVDEIDKCVGEKQYDPLGSLYALLEPESSRHFEDAAIPGLHMDASHIRWILAANSLDTIPGPILSRCRVFHIPEPDADQKRAIFANIFEAQVAATDVDDFSPHLPDEILERLILHGTLRGFQASCMLAIGNALIRGDCRCIELDFDLPVVGAKLRMGFT